MHATTWHVLSGVVLTRLCLCSGTSQQQWRLIDPYCPADSIGARKLHPSAGVWNADGIITGSESDEIIQKLWQNLNTGDEDISVNGLTYTIQSGEPGIVSVVNARVLEFVPDLFWQAPERIVVRRMISSEYRGAAKEPDLPGNLSVDGERLPQGSDWEAFEVNPRGTLLSATLYLNDNGQAVTYYPQIGVHVAARTGRLTWLRICSDANSVDPLSVHGVPPMKVGVRWTMTWYFAGNPRVHCSHRDRLPEPLTCVPRRAVPEPGEASRRVPHDADMPPGLSRSATWGSFADCRGMHGQLHLVSAEVLAACAVVGTLPDGTVHVEPARRSLACSSGHPVA
eukprot:4754752-Amphidinium_carterae.1